MILGVQYKYNNNTQSINKLKNNTSNAVSIIIINRTDYTRFKYLKCSLGYNFKLIS